MGSLQRFSGTPSQDMDTEYPCQKHKQQGNASPPSAYILALRSPGCVEPGWPLRSSSQPGGRTGSPGMPPEVLPIPQVSSAWRGLTLPTVWVPELTTGLLNGSLAQPGPACLPHVPESCPQPTCRRAATRAPTSPSQDMPLCQVGPPHPGQS